MVKFMTGMIHLRAHPYVCQTNYSNCTGFRINLELNDTVFKQQAESFTMFSYKNGINEEYKLRYNYE